MKSAMVFVLIAVCTLAGLVLEHLGRIPESPGDRIRLDGWRLEVTGVDGHRITRVSDADVEDVIKTEENAPEDLLPRRELTLASRRRHPARRCRRRQCGGDRRGPVGGGVGGGEDLLLGLGRQLLDDHGRIGHGQGLEHGYLIAFHGQVVSGGQSGRARTAVLLGGRLRLRRRLGRGRGRPDGRSVFQHVGRQPLDLLLHIIKRDAIDILDIPGMRAGRQGAEQGKRTSADTLEEQMEIVKRGKVNYLFERYTEELQIQTLLLLQRGGNLEVPGPMKAHVEKEPRPPLELREIPGALNGAILGLVAYGTYELTSWAIMRDWHPSMVAADMVWGATVTAISATGGVLIARALS